MWYVYILKCADDSLYTGITVDLARRLDEHNGNKSLGARYTRSRRPVTLAYSETADSRATAATREAAIKKLNRRQKEQLIEEYRAHALER
ncbi:MAG: GIY-YIG nuclease family protein [Gammaproteobacteria bacterium]|nr:GIY-YIG nuclease family protein [Gammaproteobacteria bacterium]